MKLSNSIRRNSFNQNILSAKTAKGNSFCISETTYFISSIRFLEEHKNLIKNVYFLIYDYDKNNFSSHNPLASHQRG